MKIKTLLSFLLGGLLAAPSLLAEIAVTPVVAEVKEVEGSLKVMRGDEVLTIQGKDHLFAGDRLETGGKDRALLEFQEDGTLVKLAYGTSLEIPRNEEVRINLSQGLLWGKKQAGGSIAFVIQTPVMAATVSGTEFFVKMTGPEEALVVVKEGAVKVDFEGQLVEVGPMSQGIFRKKKPFIVNQITQEYLASEWVSRFA